MTKKHVKQQRRAEDRKINKDAVKALLVLIVMYSGFFAYFGG